MNIEKDLEKLKSILKKTKYLSMNQIADILEWSPKYRKNNRNIILSWIDAGELGFIKQGKVALIEDCGFVKGIFSIVKNRFAFVDVEDEEGEKKGIFIPRSKFNNALDGDTVLVRVTKDKTSDKGAEGEIVKILKHDKNLIIGVLEKNKNFAFVIPTQSFGKDIYIPKSSIEKGKSGDLVVVELTFWGDESRKPEGKIIEILGSSKNTRNMIDALIIREGLRYEFSNLAMEQVNKILNLQKDTTFRKDLRHLPIITIDGADAKDLDDAVYVEKLKNGNYKLIVAIADVSYYVDFDSVLDKEARERGNSVYLVDRVLPMFPKEISNGICSLNENEDKYTFTCEMEINSNGNVVNSDMYKSIIKSAHRMTYTDVNAIFEGDNLLKNKYQDILVMLFEMRDLSHILRRKKHKRGSIDFDLPEIKVILGEDEKVSKIDLRDRGESERIIEDFMIAANEVVAERIFWLEIASVYRIHEKPNKENIFKLNETLGKFGYKIPNVDNIHPKQFQEIIESSSKKETSAIVHKMILTSLKQARYDMEDVGHFGLSSAHYTHFTSPIRRYADLMVHRVLNSVITNNLNKKITSDKNFKDICSYISKTERIAMKAEEESIRIKLVEYMSNRVGEIMEVIVSGFSQRKVFFETKEHIECSWDVTTAKHYYDFDEENYMMIDKDDNKTTFNLGDKVEVILEKTDLYNLEIIVSPTKIL